MVWTLVRVVGETLENLDGTVRSLNPAHNDPVDGSYGPYHWETRTPGTAGGYERIGINGNVVVYNPTGREAVAFPFLPTVPHSDGLSAMLEAPIKVDTVPL